MVVSPSELDAWPMDASPVRRPGRPGRLELDGVADLRADDHRRARGVVDLDVHVAGGERGAGEHVRGEGLEGGAVLVEAEGTSVGHGEGLLWCGVVGRRAP